MRQRVGLRCNHSVEKGLRCVDRKYGKIDHRRPPFFAIGQRKLKSQAADGVRCVGLKRIAAGQREAADDGDAAHLENSGLREARSLAVALEKSADAQSLGMIEAEPGMDSVDSLKFVGEPRRRQFVWREPAAQIQECSSNAQKKNANAAQPYHVAACG